MLKTCEQFVEKLGKGLWQTGFLYTLRPHKISWLNNAVVLCTKIRTAFAQFYSAFTQAESPIFNLSEGFLYPLSTKPINNTNLIKD